MLMEPDKYTSQERALTDKAKELIEQHELDWGNGECFIQRDAGHSELYPRVPRDALILFSIQRGVDIWQTDDALDKNGFPTLLSAE